MVNKVILIGNLGNDPEMRYTQSGISVTNFRLATHESRNVNGRRTEETEWHRIVAFGKLAEIINQYAAKGHLMYVEGKIVQRKWKDNQDITRYTGEIIIREMKLLTPKGKDTPTHVSEDSDEPSDYTPPKMGDDVPF